MTYSNDFSRSAPQATEVATTDSLFSRQIPTTRSGDLRYHVSEHLRPHETPRLRQNLQVQRQE